MANNESSIINNDSALPIPRQLARWLGWNEAGILQQLHWHTQEEHGQVIDGIRWIRMSETEWMEEIPLDEKAIQRAIKNLVDDGLIKAAVFSGRCKWYTVYYDAIDQLSGPVERIIQKSEKRKQARATRKDAKEQSVPIVINPINSVESNVYTNQKEQNVPIQQLEVKVQNGVETNRNKMTLEWVQNVPLQESLQESEKDSLLLIRAHDEILIKIGNLCRTNFANPSFDPFKTSLINTINRFTASKVLWAINLALSPEKANGKPKTWGYVLGILERDKDASYQAQQNGASNGTYNNQKSGRAPAGRASPGHRTDASQQSDDSGGIPAQVAAAFKRLSRASSGGT